MRIVISSVFQLSAFYLSLLFGNQHSTEYGENQAAALFAWNIFHQSAPETCVFLAYYSQEI